MHRRLKERAERNRRSMNSEAIRILERTYDVPAEAVLCLVDETGHSAYDCEDVALAQQLGGTLVTGDGPVVEQFAG